MMKHTHHVVPKYDGGSDDPSNLVELTIIQHAIRHFAEWQRKGRWEDEKAWKGLAGLVPHGELSRQIQSEGGKIGWATIKEKNLGIFGRSKEQHSRDSASGRVKGSWYNNGTLQGKYLDPPEGWVPGRLSESMNWWTDGVTNKRQFECPGEG